ncbi:MAG: hypothetical protein MN733_43125 [Nitrososphaera sp.]|nr:hypothetical protein [Nitrososphaera sp.]
MQAQTDQTIDFQKVTALHFADLETVKRSVEENETLPSVEPSEDGVHEMTTAQKRFHVLFYLTAGLTGILIVQTLWQIAILTIPQ